MDWLQDMLDPKLFWFLLGWILLLMELAAPGLVVFFLGVGAWITALVCWRFPLGLNAQLGVFLVSSLVLLLTLRTWLKGIFYGHSSHEQNLTEPIVDGIGERVTVTEMITPRQMGRVEFHGTEWNARADVDIAEGDIVEIVAMDNLTLTVRPL